MLPLLPFAAGLLTGVAAIKLWRNESTRAGIDKAQEKLRQVAASSVTAIKTTSARLGKRLAPENTPDAAPIPAEAPPKPRKPRSAKATKPEETVKPAVTPKNPRTRKAVAAPVASSEETP